MNVRVEFDSTPIRHIAVQCPACQKWFAGYDITDDDLSYDYQIDAAKFECPVCGERFGGYGDKRPVNIDEPGGADDVYKDCLRKRVEWT